MAAARESMDGAAGRVTAENVSKLFPGHFSEHFSELRRYIVVGRPQLVAVGILLLFAAQAVWLARRSPFSVAEQDHIWAGRQQLERGAVPRSFRWSPLVNLAAAAPLRLAVDAERDPQAALTPQQVEIEVRRLHLLLRWPFIIAGVLLGGALWYVARRLYGNDGGYMALLLYCFSPIMVRSAASVDPAATSAWGIFGTVFGAIAISHNLYAPWKKWRYRTALLGIAMALAVTSHPAAMLLAPVAFAFILYLAPGKRLAGTLVMVVACLLALLLIHLAYGFQPRALLDGLDMRAWLRYQPAGARAALLENSGAFLERFHPALEVLFVVSLGVYLVWKKTRYFGNTAPLLCAAGLLYLALTTPLALVATIWALPFVFVFVGGIWADLLETRYRLWAMAAFALLLAENLWVNWRLLA